MNSEENHLKIMEIFNGSIAVLRCIYEDNWRTLKLQAKVPFLLNGIPLDSIQEYMMTKTRVLRYLKMIQFFSTTKERQNVW